MDTRSGSWNAKSLYRVGALKTTVGISKVLLRPSGSTRCQMG
jgi:hypothetical protein